MLLKTKKMVAKYICAPLTPPKRVFNLLWGVNQGCGLLLARDLEKRESVAWLTPLRRLNTLLEL